MKDKKEIARDYERYFENQFWKMATVFVPVLVAFAALLIIYQPSALLSAYFAFFGIAFTLFVWSFLENARFHRNYYRYHYAGKELADEFEERQKFYDRFFTFPIRSNIVSFRILFMLLLVLLAFILFSSLFFPRILILIV